MKLLAGHDQELMQIISTFLGCDKEKIMEGECIDATVQSEVLNLVRETSYSHLLEVKDSFDFTGNAMRLDAY